MKCRREKDERKWSSRLPLEVRFAIRTWGVKSLLGPCAGNYNAGYYENAYLSCVCFAIISWVTAAAQDGVKVAPENYKVLLDNTHVRVVDFTLKPGQKSPMVSRPNRVIYAITPAIGKLTGSDGKTIPYEQEGRRSVVA